MDAQVKEIKNKVMYEINSFAIVYFFFDDRLFIPITEVSNAILIWVSSTYANILKYHIQGMLTNIILQVFI
jgi:hypothetical protein